MIPIKIELPIKKFDKALTNYEKQSNFAMARAVNRTMEQRQLDEQEHIARTLKIRNGTARSYFRRVVQFGRADRADHKVQPIAAQLRIIGGTEAARTDVFKRFGALVLRHADGGARTSDQLYRNQRNELSPEGFAIPAPGLRTATRGVPRNLYPAAIGLTSRRAIEGGFHFANQYKGGKKKRGGFRKGTKYYFVKEGVGIFVREQLGKHSEYDALWFFRRRITLKPELKLDSVFQGGLSDHLARNYAVMLADALRTAK